MQYTTLVDEFEHYSTWREAVYVRVEALRDWLEAQELGDAESGVRLNQLLARLQDDTLNVAFVAEFSRGKSELINAIFFSDYRQRVLPSSAGRTTMCPTELFFDPLHRPSLRLLPIDTRTREGSIADFKRDADAWTEFPLNLDSAEEMSATLVRLADTLDVDVSTAEAFGLINPDDEDTAHTLEHDGSIAIPRWRHALINFPHPLLKQGLVILDTPGLNAIGTEPELTFNLLPNAHAVMFLLAADTGVTRSDIEIWRHIASVQSASRARLVVLNKIDGLWDELKTPAQINAEIAKQVASSAALLDLPAGQVYPVSAQKGLVAKVRDDAALLAKSRLPELEAALTQELIPCKQTLVSESSRAAVEDVVIRATELLETRLATLQDQVDELQLLRGKNRDVIQHMMIKANDDKEQFERGLEQFNALRSVFATQVDALRRQLGMQGLRHEVDLTRQAMEKSHFSAGLREAMSRFFRQVGSNLDGSAEAIGEIRAMMTAMYRKFSDEHGLAAVSPPDHSLHKYHREMARLERIFDERFNTVFKMLTVGQSQLTARFFETLASKVVQVFELANSETESWLKALIAPMETQVREHKLQLKRRLESVSRIHAATETLDERIAELEASIGIVSDQLDSLARINLRIADALADELGGPSLARTA
ncbi:MAG: GTPase [Thiobacillus sp. 63-78]|uniref:dynamin family protein n=1 Tax=Thiobacillus sp. 63-78 TaxID=1895859 RepID=UPI0009683FEA|nr:dynamin family protein [Thiobacillus sp. 63-78]MBN8763203.1 dynamin family protein [Thiobacillus sp.]MBN8773921.1 dynamin family protein [Thiobacillus sp.]OJZ14814.1 MAG: GTPase [Thiobacillus sp. 63-78]